MALEEFSDEKLAEIYRRFRITFNRLGEKEPGYRMMCSELKKPKDWIDFVENQSDDFYYGQLIEVPFFGGMKANTVVNHLDAIHRHLDDFSKTSNCGEKEIEEALNDPKMIHHRGKVEAAIENAKVFSRIVDDYGSFGKFIASYGFYRNHETLLRLQNDIMGLFRYFGNANAWFYLRIIGLPSVKPDVHVKRIFYRIGLIGNEGDEDGVIVAALRMAHAVSVPLDWIDDFVFLGQEDHFYPKSEVCGSKPECDREINPCEIKDLCNYFKEHRP